jgi:hypothetical protein
VNFVGVEVLAADSRKMAVFWVVAPCSTVKFIGLMMEAARISETSVNFYQTIWHYNSEDSHLHGGLCFLKANPEKGFESSNFSSEN